MHAVSVSVHGENARTGKRRGAYIRDAARVGQDKSEGDNAEKTINRGKYAEWQKTESPVDAPAAFSPGGERRAQRGGTSREALEIRG